MVFDSEMVEDYREGKEQAYASSNYEFGSDSTIKFSDISREYLYKVISDDIVCFYCCTIGTLTSSKSAIVVSE